MAPGLSKRRFPCGFHLERAVRIDVSSANCRAKSHFQVRTSVRNPIFRCPPLRCPPLGPPETWILLQPCTEWVVRGQRFWQRLGVWIGGRFDLQSWGDLTLPPQLSQKGWKGAAPILHIQLSKTTPSLRLVIDWGVWFSLWIFWGRFFKWNFSSLFFFEKQAGENPRKNPHKKSPRSSRNLSLIFLSLLFGFPCLFRCKEFPCFFERFSLLSHGFWGFSREKKILAFFVGFLAFSQKSKEKKIGVLTKIHSGQILPWPSISPNKRMLRFPWKVLSCNLRHTAPSA